MNTFKKRMALLMVIVTLSTVAGGALAADYFDFGGYGGTGNYAPGRSYVIGEAKVLEKLYTRTGPSTRYEEGGSANMVGQKVKVYGWQPDENGVRWIIVDIRVGGKLRRVYTKSMYLDMGKIANQVYSAYEADKYYEASCTVMQDIRPKYGPGTEYETHSRMLRAGTKGVCLYDENGYCLVDYGTIRVWVPDNALNFF